jgi:hypothetical protein
MLHCPDKINDAEAFISNTIEDLADIYRLDCIANTPISPRSKQLAEASIHRLNLTLFACEVRAIANGRKILTDREMGRRSAGNTRRSSVSKVASKEPADMVGFELSKLKKTSSVVGSVLEGLAPSTEGSKRPSVTARSHPLQSATTMNRPPSAHGKLPLQADFPSDVFHDMLALADDVVVSPKDEENDAAPMSRFGSLISLAKPAPEKIKSPAPSKFTAKKAVVAVQDPAALTQLASNLTSMIQVFQTRSDQLWGIVEGLAALGVADVGLKFATCAEGGQAQLMTEKLLDFGFILIINPQENITSSDFFSALDILSTPTEGDLEVIQARNPLQRFDMKAVIALNRRFFEWRQWHSLFTL